MYDQAWELDVARCAARRYIKTAPLPAKRMGFWHWLSLAWERIHTYNKKGRFDRLDKDHAVKLGVVAGTTICIDWWRTQSEHRRGKNRVWKLSLDALGTTGPGDIIATPHYYEEENYKDRLVELWAACKFTRVGFSIRARVFMYLWLVEEWTYSEIADYFGCSVGYPSTVMKGLIDHADEDVMKALKELGSDRSSSTQRVTGVQLNNSKNGRRNQNRSSNGTIN